MKKYNSQDVRLLEDVYGKLLPWIGNHPNVAVMADVENGCRNCGKTQLTKRGFHTTATGRRQRYQCNSCLTYMQGKHTSVTEIR